MDPLPYVLVTSAKWQIPRKREEGTLDMGKEAILLDCIATPGSNIVEVSDRIKEELEDIKLLLPEGFEVTITDDISTFVRESIRNVFRDMVVGILLTGLVLFLFLATHFSHLCCCCGNAHCDYLNIYSHVCLRHNDEYDEHSRHCHFCRNSR